MIGRVGTTTGLVMAALTAAVLVVLVSVVAEGRATGGDDGADELDVAWRWSAPEAQHSAQVRASDGVVAVTYGPDLDSVGSQGPGMVVLLDGGDGGELWRFATPATPFRAAIADDVVVVGTGDGDVVGLDRTSGRQRWHQGFPGVPAQVLTAGDIVVVADAMPREGGARGSIDDARLDGRVWALAAATGSVLWTCQVGGVEAMIAATEDLVVVAPSNLDGTEGSAFAFHIRTGEVAWEAPGLRASGPPVVDNGIVVVPGDGLRALELATGTEVWAVAGHHNRAAVFGGEAVLADAAAGRMDLRSLDDGSLLRSGEGGDCGLAHAVEFEGLGMAVRCGVPIIAWPESEARPLFGEPPFDVQDMGATEGTLLLLRTLPELGIVVEARR